MLRVFLVYKAYVVSWYCSIAAISGICGISGDTNVSVAERIEEASVNSIIAI